MSVRWTRIRRRVLLFLTVMGPGIITASVDQDAGGITTYSVAGAQYGYTHLWSLPFIILALAVVQEMGTRMGVVTGRGLADLIRERFGVRLTLLAMAILVLANIANTASEFAGVAASLEIFGISRHWSVPLTAVLVFCLVVQGTYKAIERIFLAASALYAVYFLSAFLAKPPWADDPAPDRPSDVFPARRLPHDAHHHRRAPPSRPGCSSTCSPPSWTRASACATFAGPSWTPTSGAWPPASSPSSSSSPAAPRSIPNGIRVETAKDAALALEPFAGRYATILFAFGLLNASDLLRRHPSPVHRLRRLRGAGLGDRRGPPAQGGARLLHHLHPDDPGGGGPDPPPARAAGGDHVLVADTERRSSSRSSCWSC